MTRIVEKARLKGGEFSSAACVKDIVRAMIVVDSMDEVAIMQEVLLDLQPLLPGQRPDSRQLRVSPS